MARAELRVRGVRRGTTHPSTWPYMAGRVCTRVRHRMPEQAAQIVGALDRSVMKARENMTIRLYRVLCSRLFLR